MESRFTNASTLEDGEGLPAVPPLDLRILSQKFCALLMKLHTFIMPMLRDLRLIA
jgi:hypothetical protein